MAVSCRSTSSAIGICGTDFHIFQGKHPFLDYPRVMGHELSGVVAEDAADGRLPPGMPVVINPYLSCGTMRRLPQGQAQLLRDRRRCSASMSTAACASASSSRRITSIRPTISSLRDAAMVEFQAIGAHAVRRSESRAGDRVLVVGAGPIGVGTGIFADWRAAEVTLMDVSEARLAYVARTARPPSTRSTPAPGRSPKCERPTGGDLYDVVFDATGNARAMEASFAYVANGGTLVFVGVLKADITFSDPEFHRREMTAACDAQCDQARLRNGDGGNGARGKSRMDAINTHTARLDALPDAMPAWLASNAPPLKAIVTV